MVDKSKVNKYIPKNAGVVHAVLWTGKAECLVGMPNLNEIIMAIQSIDRTGAMRIICESTPEDDQTNVRPWKDYIVIDSFDKVDVWQEDFIRQNYDLVPEMETIRAVPRMTRDEG